MALELSAFSVILLAQNQASSDYEQDSRAETSVICSRILFIITSVIWKFVVKTMCGVCSHIISRLVY